MRLDKLLWFLRLARTRSRAQAWIGEGHIRRNGQRVERQGPHQGAQKSTRTGISPEDLRTSCSKSAVATSMRNYN